MKLIEMNIDKIAALCRMYKVEKLWVFGSNGSLYDASDQ